MINNIEEVILQLLKDNSTILKELLAIRTCMNDRFKKIDERFDILEKNMNDRFEEVDKRFEQIDARFEQVDKRFEQIDARFEQVGSRFEQIDKRFDKNDSFFDELQETLILKFRMNDQKQNEFSHSLKKLQNKSNVI